MIKKLLSTFLFTVTSILVTAQCTPDITCVPAGSTYGVCPDSTTGLKHGVVNTPYVETVSLLIPTKTDDFGVPGGTVTNIVVNKVEGLEPNLSYQCNPTNCTFPGGSQGCALISGTPSQVWNQPIIVKITAHVTVLGFPTTFDRDLTGYRCVVTTTTGIESLSTSKFDVGQNTPNPFSGKSEIHFTVINSENVDFKVYNLLGAVIYTNSFKAEKGQNSIIIEANSFAPGVYIYSIGNTAQTITKRMVVSR